MLQLTNAFVNLKQAIIRRVVHMHEAKYPRVEPFVFEKPQAAADLDDDLLLTPNTFPIFVQFPTELDIETSSTYSTQEATRESLSVSSPALSASSPASAFPPSLFSHRNVSTSTTLTVPPPSLWLKGCDLDTEDQQTNIPDMDDSEDFALFLRHAQDTEIQYQADYIWDTPQVEAKRSVFRGCVEGPSPSELEIGVVVPSDGPTTDAASFVFGVDMVHFTPLVKYLAQETGRRRWDDIILVSKVYPGTVRDQESFNGWMKWSMGRKASEDLVLYAI